MGSTLATPWVAGPSFGQDAEFRLKLHHFLARNGNVPAKFIAPWARKIETESKGRIKINVFPSMQLGGNPQQLFDQARDGVVDIVWTLPAYTAGRFPIIEVFDLPFIGARKAVPNSKALQEFSERHLRDEFREVHPICFFAQDHGVIHANSVLGHDAFNPGTNFHDPRNVRKQNGVVFFPGSSGVYKVINGVPLLVGGLGVSGDGVEQDDYVSQLGSDGFHPPDTLRVDNSVIRNSAGQIVRLPYLKFPRHPEFDQ